MLSMKALGRALPRQSSHKTLSGSGGSLETLKPFLLLVGLMGLGGVSPLAAAGVEVRVESRPMDQPIDAYVLVTDGTTPVPGLTAQEFQVMLDGVPLDPIEFALPPREDPAQRVSILIVAAADRFLNFLNPDHSALLNGLERGDRVSVVRYWRDSEEPGSRFGGITTLPFTRLDNGAGSQAVSDFLEAPASTHLFDGPKFLLDGLRRGLREFAAPDVPLPDGPKAIVAVDDVVISRSYSLSNVIGVANKISIPIFNVGHAGLDRYSKPFAAAGEALAKYTGGIRVPLAEDDEDELALPKIATWLEDGYRITLPPDAVTDCKRHVLEIVVRGETSSRRFVRCDTTPKPFTFNNLTDVAVDTVVVSEPVTITGIDTAVGVKVIRGEYSIGCSAPFTSEFRLIQPGQSVCVRHRTAPEKDAYRNTWLYVGGVSARFESHTLWP